MPPNRGNRRKNSNKYKNKSENRTRLYVRLVIIVVVGILLFNLITDESADKARYPRKYPFTVNSEARKYNLDPNIIYSIIKAESKFDKEAVSHKGAKGLMQIMPDTAQWIATKLDREITDDDLFDPQTNIKLGTWYFNRLYGLYDGNLALAAAAYNAGEGNVAKWLKNGTWNGMIGNVNDIPFEETRNYVKKVLNNYEKYKSIYENE